MGLSKWKDCWVVHFDTSFFSGLYLPIKVDQTVGVLVYYPKRERLLSLEEMNFLQTIAQHLGVYLQRNQGEVKSQD